MQLKRQLTDRRTPYDLLDEARENRAKGFPFLASVLEAEAEWQLRRIEYKQRLKEAEQMEDEYED